MGLLLNTLTRPPLAQTEATLAREASELLKRLLEKRPSFHLRLELDGSESDHEAIVLPLAVMRLLLYVLDEMANGNGVALVSLQAELTTQQAADMLNVSRPILVRLIDEGRLPHRMVGTHRRVRVDDLLAYQYRVEAERGH